MCSNRLIRKRLFIPLFVSLLLLALLLTQFRKNVNLHLEHEELEKQNLVLNARQAIEPSLNTKIFPNIPRIPTQYLQLFQNTPQQQIPTLQLTDDKKQKMLYILNKLERLVHIDLKGAPPKPDYFKEFLPLIKKYGATGVILEYEDMFPYTGRLSVVKHGNAYSKDDIKLILKLAKDNNLTVMPLVQTYGHLEWVLKHKDFAHLRENPEFPQVISPCIPESYKLILGISFLSLKACLLYYYLNIDMIDQVIALHPDVPYFHIGCDEVYYKLTNQKCNDPSWPHGTDFTKAFMR
jgi:hypothetical protein